MEPLRYLPIFLKAGCNFTQGALHAGRPAHQFRDLVLNDLFLLEKTLAVPQFSLRATDLRTARDRLIVLTRRYARKLRLENRKTRT